MVESKPTFDQLPTVVALKSHFHDVTSKTHLRELLSDDTRNSQLRASLKSQLHLDFTHAKLDAAGFNKLLEVAKEASV